MKTKKSLCAECNCYHYCASWSLVQKGATKLMAVTSSNLNRFSKFFHHWKEKEISNKLTYYFPPHLKYVAALPVGIQKFKFVVKLPNKFKTCIIFVKNESFIHIPEWILLLSQQLLKVSNVCPHTSQKRCHAHTTDQLHCQWRSDPFRARCAANAAVTFYDF